MSSPRARGVDLTTGSLWWGPAMVALPAIGQALLANVYGLNDYVFVGRLADPAMTAALASSYAWAIANQSLVQAVSIGATTRMAIHVGARDERAFTRTLADALVGSVVVAVGLAVAFGLALDPILRFANVTDEVLHHAKGYFGVLLLANPALAILRTIEGAYRARGDTRTPLWFEAAGVATNTALTALLVLGPGPLPSFGVVGAAIATVVGIIVPTVWSIVRLRAGDVGAVPGRDMLASASWRRIARLARIGGFAAMSGVIYGVVYLMMNRVAGAIGPAAQGGLGAGLRGIEWVAFAIGEGFTIACLTWVGQHLGAGRVDRLKRGMWSMIGAGAVVVQLISLPFWFAPDALASAVAPDGQTAAMAATYLRIMAWGMWAVAVDLAIHGALTGAGLTHVSMAIGLVGNLVRVPIAAAAVFGASWASGALWILFGIGPVPIIVGGFSGVAWAICISAIAKAFVYVAALARVDWDRRVGIEREIEALH